MCLEKTGVLKEVNYNKHAHKRTRHDNINRLATKHHRAEMQTHQKCKYSLQ